MKKSLLAATLALAGVFTLSSAEVLLDSKCLLPKYPQRDVGSTLQKL